MKRTASKQTTAASQHCRGVSLVELMVAITIGLILIFGATQVYVNSKASYESNEAVSRLQETARYAMSVIEPDIRMGNNWGLTNRGGSLTIVSTGPQTCGTNFATLTGIPVQGDNNGYGATGTGGITCAAYGTGAVASADTITVRHVTATIKDPLASTLQVCSNVDGAIISSAIGSGSCATTLTQQLNDLVANTYYVDRDSSQAAGLPSLRRKELIGGPAFQDVEIIPGVEDLQVQYGIAAAGSTDAVRYVDTWTAGMNVVAVRLWLLIRAENIEAGFTDNKTYEYGDRTQATGITNDLNAANSAGRAYRPADGYRRLLISRTIQIRSALAS